MEFNRRIPKNGMRLLLEVFFFSFKDIVYIGLRVEIDQRKPGALNLDLQFMPFLEGVIDSLEGDIHIGFLLGVNGSGFSKLLRKRPRITSLRTIIW